MTEPQPETEYLQTPASVRARQWDGTPQQARQLCEWAEQPAPIIDPDGTFTLHNGTTINRHDWLVVTTLDTGHPLTHVYDDTTFHNLYEPSTDTAERQQQIIAEAVQAELNLLAEASDPGPESAAEAYGTILAALAGSISVYHERLIEAGIGHETADMMAYTVNASMLQLTLQSAT